MISSYLYSGSRERVVIIVWPVEGALSGFGKNNSGRTPLGNVSILLRSAPNCIRRWVVCSAQERIQSARWIAYLQNHAMILECGGHTTVRLCATTIKG